ncbi:MAG: DUF92 domain-containing protein [Silvibacterium sp.]|jgi:uncharacterized protein (TIGR00297 family)
MPDRNADRLARPSLHWQSQLILLLIFPLVGVFVLLELIQLWPVSSVPLVALAIGAAFAVLVWMLRAATPAASLTGGLFTVSLYLWTPGWRTLLWSLLALFLLTFAATRFGRRHKEKLGTAEGKRGRSASQVAANLGVAVVAGIPLSTRHVWLGIYPGRVALIAAIASLSEATADTLSSELGQVLGGEPRLVTTLRRVPTGTDGAISLIGTLAGAVGATIVTAVAAIVFHLTPRESAIAFAGGIVGLFIDSLLGATLERRGWLNNDAVNAVSTLAAALFAAWVVVAINARG